MNNISLHILRACSLFSLIILHVIGKAVLVLAAPISILRYSWIRHKKRDSRVEIGAPTVNLAGGIKLNLAFCNHTMEATNYDIYKLFTSGLETRSCQGPDSAMAMSIEEFVARAIQNQESVRYRTPTSDEPTEPFIPESIDHAMAEYVIIGDIPSIIIVKHTYDEQTSLSRSRMVGLFLDGRWLISMRDNSCSLEVHDKAGAKIDYDSRAILESLPWEVINMSHYYGLAPKPNTITLFPADFPRGSPIILDRGNFIKFAAEEWHSCDSITLPFDKISDEVGILLITLMAHDYDVYGDFDADEQGSDCMEGLSRHDAITYFKIISYLGITRRIPLQR